MHCFETLLAPLQFIFSLSFLLPILTLAHAASYYSLSNSWWNINELCELYSNVYSLDCYLIFYIYINIINGLKRYLIKEIPNLQAVFLYLNPTI